MDNDCEDQGLFPTEVCTKFQCQIWDGDTQISYPKLVLRGKDWCCPKCHSSYGEHAKGSVTLEAVAETDADAQRDDGLLSGISSDPT